jgi:hypothetical protein
MANNHYAIYDETTGEITGTLSIPESKSPKEVTPDKKCKQLTEGDYCQCLALTAQDRAVIQLNGIKIERGVKSIKLPSKTKLEEEVEELRRELSEMRKLLTKD